MLKFAAEQLKLIQSLFLDLFDPSQLRKFITEWGGRSIANQIPPEVVSPELLVHGITLTLERNGMLDETLFVELCRERPRCKSAIERVAQEFGIAVPSDTTLVATSGPLVVRTPDYVIHNAYESLRRQRDLLRTFFQGPVSIHGIIEILGRDQDLTPAVEAIRAWVREHAGAFSFAPVRNALHQIGLLSAGLAARDPALKTLMVFAAALAIPQLEGHLKGLSRFAQLTESELYSMALQQQDGG